MTLEKRTQKFHTWRATTQGMFLNVILRANHRWRREKSAVFSAYQIVSVQWRRIRGYRIYNCSVDIKEALKNGAEYALEFIK